MAHSSVMRRGHGVSWLDAQGDLDDFSADHFCCEILKSNHQVLSDTGFHRFLLGKSLNDSGLSADSLAAITKDAPTCKPGETYAFGFWSTESGFSLAYGPKPEEPPLTKEQEAEVGALRSGGSLWDLHGLFRTGEFVKIRKPRGAAPAPAKFEHVRKQVVSLSAKGEIPLAVDGVYDCKLFCGARKSWVVVIETHSVLRGGQRQYAPNCTGL